ncbi:MAG: zf-HC2 domain-containing protein [Chloroflexi bacterium]|nr:zf-HC2 domain-containing protein [Chloroflexota bacterium]
MQFAACNHCRSHLIGYINRELTPAARRRVAEHLDSCPACYSVYLRKRDAAHELANGLTLIGRSDAPQLGDIWNAVQSGMAGPRRRPWQFQKQHSLVVLLLIIGLLLPWSFTQRQVVLAVPVPPTPRDTQITQHTPSSTGFVALEPAATAAAPSTANPGGTMTPRVESNYAPLPGANGELNDLPNY